MPEPAKIRNVAVVGHRGTGKTSLVEALLFQTGKNTLGRSRRAAIAPAVNIIDAWQVMAAHGERYQDLWPR